MNENNDEGGIRLHAMWTFMGKVAAGALMLALFLIALLALVWIMVSLFAAIVGAAS